MRLSVCTSTFLWLMFYNRMVGCVTKETAHVTKFVDIIDPYRVLVAHYLQKNQELWDIACS